MVYTDLAIAEITPLTSLIRKKMKSDDRHKEITLSSKAVTKVYCTSFESRIGKIYVASTDEGVCKISVPRESRKDFIGWIEQHFDLETVVDNRSRNKDVIDQLNRYFNGKLAKFNLGIDLMGTPFQIRVWKELLKVEYGTTITYKQLAKRVKTPQAFQAVGRANASNPLPVIIPCHRVLGSNGSLVGYGAGIKTKEFLLRLEGAIML
ncbi:MAG: methylated-DNA--[protein]-cysteine S-methyltransferase [Bacteroidetes bacterium]|nr:MAG: methylated-DNA--[protein]-cysteine S-methyltransferase [Bacteroidota bacterium]